MQHLGKKIFTISLDLASSEHGILVVFGNAPDLDYFGILCHLKLHF